MLIAISFWAEQQLLDKQANRIQPNSIERRIFEFLLHLYYLQYLTQLDINRSVFNC